MKAQEPISLRQYLVESGYQVEDYRPPDLSHIDPDGLGKTLVELIRELSEEFSGVADDLVGRRRFSSSEDYVAAHPEGIVFQDFIELVRQFYTASGYHERLSNPLEPSISILFELDRYRISQVTMSPHPPGVRISEERVYRPLDAWTRNN
jgi:hypothetical protein